MIKKLTEELVLQATVSFGPLVGVELQFLLTFGTRQSIMPQQLRENRLWYLLDRRLGGYNSKSGCRGEEQILPVLRAGPSSVA
jgi:hypothetical protein